MNNPSCEVESIGLPLQNHIGKATAVLKEVFYILYFLTFVLLKSFFI